MAEERYGDFVVVRRHGERVAELVLDRPKAMNAVSTAMAAAIEQACAALAADPSVSVTVLSSSSDRAFCAGADLKERNSLSDAELLRQRPRARAAYTGVLDLPMPVLAAVGGFALGGGYELALACDLIVADGNAVVGLPEVSVGVIPGGGGTQLLPRRVGAARAAELVYTARRVPAVEALALGLVDQLTPGGGGARRRARTGRADRRELARGAAGGEAGVAAGAGGRSAGRARSGGRGMARRRFFGGPGGGGGGLQREALAALAEPLTVVPLALRVRLVRGLSRRSPRPWLGPVPPT